MPRTTTPAALLVLGFVACDPRPPAAADVWPYRAAIPPGTYATWPEELVYKYCDPVPPAATASLRRVTVAEAAVDASDFFVTSDRGDLVRARLATGPVWIVHPAPISEAQRRFVLNLEGKAQRCVEVLPFSDGDRAWVTTPGSIITVMFSTERVRVMDQLGAMLEGCAMQSGRSSVSCGLDLSFDQARFDPDGQPLDDSFTPQWVPR